ncbi:hypothetical protein EJB05_17061 [Eragrostis curvula]|uniref:Uncharacterized protein n=1 Tax=Eragrostis curvula TaxID=38414 RepID=A0A5J9VIF4_9POAL|nr:hypothetical protein EJB05_17061 [Eragrostis curvula]
MAAAAGGARRALGALRSGSPPTLSTTLSRQAVARSPELAAGAASLPRASRRRLAISRVPVAALGGVQGSLMPMHSATASALLTSMLGLKPGSWGWLSEGKLDQLRLFCRRAVNDACHFYLVESYRVEGI